MPTTAERTRDLTERLRAYVLRERETLWEEFRAAPTGAWLCARHAALFDVLLAEMYRLATAAVEERGEVERGEAQLCVAAVGGYGRASLAPWSDIDIVFIPSHEAHPFTDAVVREMLVLISGTLTPTALPQMSHSYRPLSDLGLIDHQTATALLESRRIAGDGSLHIHFMHELMRSIDAVEFLHLNLGERRQVWDDPIHSLFAVEPDLKSGPGGLRDFHAAIWVAKVVYRIADWDVLAELQRRGVITPEEREAVVRAIEFNLKCRNWLHLAKGQKLDVIHTDYQEDLARGLGYTGDADRAAAEDLMDEHYRQARVIAFFSRRLFDLARQQRLEFQEGLYVEDWTLCPAHDGIFRERRARLVGVYFDCQRLQLRRSLELERQIVAAAPTLCEDGRPPREAGTMFREILASPADVAGTLRAMLMSGVLEQLLPEFAPLMTFLPGDPAHEYTVGEHSLKVVEQLQRLRDQPEDEDERVLSDVLRALQEPEVLFFAALFHDVGKLDRSGKHSETGWPVAEAVARRLGFQDTAVERIGFLVLRHLELMRTARLGALGLPDTIERFCAQLPEGNPLDALDMLTLLTWADTRSVGQGVLRPADRRLVMELFSRASKWIRERPLDSGPVSLDRVQRRLIGTDALKDMDPERLRRHLDRMPTWYAVNTPPALIAKHIGYLDRLAGGEDPVVEFYQALRAVHTELTVCTTSRRGLLRDLAACVTANNLDIYLANLDIWGAGEGMPQGSIITIWVDDFGQPLGPVKRDRLHHDIETVLGGQESVPELFARRGKTVPQDIVVYGVRISNDDSAQHTVVIIRAADQRGLLYRLTSALVEEQLDTVVAKVTTWRGAAEDAFYVVSADTGGKVPDEDLDSLAERLRRSLSGETVGETAG